MQLHKKEIEYKHALALQNELNELYRKKWQIPSIKLEKPIQHGYVRALELRPDVVYRKDYEQIKLAFSLCGQQKVYSNNINFITNRKTKQQSHAYLKTVRDPRFRFYVRESQREEALENIKKCKRHLRWCGSIYECNCEEHVSMLHLFGGKNKFQVHYKFSNPWLLQETTKPHMLTHYKPVDSDLESRIKHINNEMENKKYNYLLNRYRSTYDKIYNQQFIAIKYKDDQLLHAIDLE
jgi:hypothetical protein